MQDKVYNVRVDGVQDAQKDMSNLNKTVEKTETDFKTLSKAISDGTKQLAAMKLQGQEGTKAYDDLARSLGNMKDAMGDARAAVNAYANDTKNLTDALDVFKTGTSVVGLYQSALVALGADGSKVEQTMKKLLAVETALNSVQKIQNSLMNKSSGTYKVAALGIKAYQWAMQGATLATQAFRAALISTGIGAIVVVIGTLAANFDKVTESVKNLISNIPYLKDLIPNVEGLDNLKKFSDAIKDSIDYSIKLAEATKDWTGAIKLQNQVIEDAKLNIESLDRVLQGTLNTSVSKRERISSDAINELKKTYNEAGQLALQLTTELNNVNEFLSREFDKVQRREPNIFLNDPTATEDVWESLEKNYDKFANKYIQNLQSRQEKAVSVFNETEKLVKDALSTIHEQDLADRYRILSEDKDLDELEIKNLKAQQQLRIKTAESNIKEYEKNINKPKEDAEKNRKEKIKKELEDEKNLIDLSKLNGEYEIDNLDKKIKLEEKLLKNNLESKSQYLINVKKLELEKEKFLEERNKKSRKLDEEAYKAEEEYAIYKLNNLHKYYEDEGEFAEASLIKDEIINKEYALKKELLDRELYEKLLENKEMSEDDIMTLTNLYNTKKLRLDEELNQALLDNQNLFNEKLSESFEEQEKKRVEQLEKQREYFLIITNETLNTVAGITDSIFELIDANIQRTIDAIQKSIDSIDSMLNKVDRNINRHINRLTGYYEALSDATGEEKQDLLAYIKDQEDALNHQYDLEKQLEAEKYQREKQLQKEQAIQQKKQLQNQLIQAIITGASATLNGFNTQPFMPVGIAMGALAATLSAVQIGVIGANIGRIKYANGGLLSGPSHNDGGIPVGNTGVEVEGGEYVVNKKATAKYLPLLEQINDYGSSVRKFANGGEMNLTTGSDQTAALLSNINFNPVVAVTDINRANSRLDKVKVLSR